jgi:hypothetical protein
VTDLVVFLVIVTGLLAVGIRVGMLVAPRLTRWGERDDEDPNDD